MTDSSNYWSNTGSGALGDDTADNNRSFDLLRYGQHWKNNNNLSDASNSFQAFEHLTSEKSAIYDQRKFFNTNQVYSNEYYQNQHNHNQNTPNITASAVVQANNSNNTLSSSQALSSSLFSNSSNSICSPIENNTTLTQQFNQLKLQTKSNKNNNYAFNQHHSNNTENNINSNSNRTSFNLSNYFNQNLNSHSVVCSSPSNIDINSPTSNILDSDSNYQSPPHDFDNGFKQRPNTLPLASTFAEQAEDLSSKFDDLQLTYNGSDSGKLFVGGLPPSCTQEDMHRYFTEFGIVIDANVKMNPKTGLSRGFGFVKFKSEQAVKAVLEFPAPHIIHGKIIDPKQARRESSFDSAFLSGYSNYIPPFGPSSEPLIEEPALTPEDSKRNCYKIFVGGIPVEACEAHLKDYFQQFGSISYCEIKRNSDTQQSRGFGFVTFQDKASIDRVLNQREHWICGKQVDPKIAEQKPNSLNNLMMQMPMIPNQMNFLPIMKNPNDIDTADDRLKIFVGGLPKEATNEDLARYFSKFGLVQQAVVKIDSITYASRGFGFVLFANQAGVINALSQLDHRMFGKLIDPKLAMPQAGLSLESQMVTGNYNLPMAPASINAVIKSEAEPGKKFGPPPGLTKPMAQPQNPFEKTWKSIDSETAAENSWLKFESKQKLTKDN